MPRTGVGLLRTESRGVAEGEGSNEYSSEPEARPALKLHCQESCLRVWGGAQAKLR